VASLYSTRTGVDGVDGDVDGAACAVAHNAIQINPTAQMRFRVVNQR
jgi:hypothetical protein